MNQSNANLENVSNRIKKLEDIEKKITTAIQSAGLTFQELSKEKPTDRLIEKHSSTFTQSLDEVETEMASQISYLSQVATNQQHEGSSYAARNKAQQSKEVISHLSTQVGDMLQTCTQASFPR
nr:mediator of RNA polymerase II transcription subunit 11-like [Ciona intestinalis]|eukprot:XP_002127165.1 mediator of RNA polymerase II transcription subunit 11-like [Ciona intestinalis]